MLEQLKRKLKMSQPSDEFLAINAIYKKNLESNTEITIIDVGSNRGQSVLRFNSIFTGHFVHCFEPTKTAFADLKSKRFENVKLNNIALSEKKSRGIFYEYDKSTNSSFYKPDTESDWYRIKAKNAAGREVVKDKYEVETLTLDEYAKENAIESIEILKIDTQGFEPNVLMGARELLANKRIRFIETEVTFMNAYEKDVPFSSIESLVFDNYRVVNITPRNVDNCTKFADVLFERR